MPPTPLSKIPRGALDLVFILETGSNVANGADKPKDSSFDEPKDAMFHYSSHNRGY
jgi:hypothetical protein